MCQDAYTASTCGFTYTIHLAHATTGLFANANDEDVRVGHRIPSRPPSEMTAATYHLAKIDFALRRESLIYRLFFPADRSMVVVRDFIDAINLNFPNAAYRDIMDLDTRFRRVYESLPSPLRPDLPQPFETNLSGSHRFIVEQRTFMGITLHNRIMRLHRAYMLQGYDDGNYAYSTGACLEAAYALLALVQQSRQILCRWWVVLIHVWTSGLIISVDMFKGPNEVERRLRQRTGIELAVSLLE